MASSAKNTSPQMTVTMVTKPVPSDNQYECMEILGERYDKKLGCSFFHVRWASCSEDSWEPRNSLSGYQSVIKRWEDDKGSIIPIRPIPGAKKRPASINELQINKKLKSIKKEESHKTGSTQERINDRPLTISEVVSGAIGPTIRTKSHTANIPKKRMLVKSFISGPTPQKILEHEDYKKYTKKLAQLAGPKIHLHNDVDEEPCPPLGFEFITELKLGRGVNPWSDEFSSGCDCKNGCKKGCNCIEILPDGFGNLSYKNGLVIHDSDFVIYECNPMCSCGPGCQNSVVGRGRQHEFEIFKTALKGWGLRCREPLKKGTFIGLYLGEVVNPEEASKRAKMGDEMKLSYLFDLDKFNKDDQENRVDDSEDELSKGMGEDHKDSYAIDGRECGTYTRFINHSCDPNCVAYAVVSGRRDLEVYDLAMFTARNIAPFEELSFEYTMEDDHIPSASIKDTSKCHCGAANCRGFLW